MSNKIKIRKKWVSSYNKIINPLTGADAGMTYKDKENSDKVCFTCVINTDNGVYEFRTHNMSKFGKRDLIMSLPSDDERNKDYGFEMLVQLVVIMLRRETEEKEGLFMVETSPDNGKIKYVFRLTNVEDSDLMNVEPVIDDGHGVKFQGKPFRFDAESLAWMKEESDV